ncbi:MAG TPA: acyl-CoA dehydrogenase family protein [Dehalococcoidia bacterium]|nr:acyl-CoA dehydrogenase family protein [Dehalococcoidia bacterium]
MDFAFSEEQLAIGRLAREFAEREIGDRPAEWDREERFPPREISRGLGALGLMGGAVPGQYGGSDMDYVSLVLMVEELSRFCTTTGLLAAWPSCSLGSGLLLYGTEEQRQKYLTPLCRGERLGGTAVTEPHSGTDIVRRMESTCVRAGDDYLLNGAKIWISNIEQAEWFITFAALDKGRGHRGLCAFVVEKDWPGVTWRPIHNKVGSRMMQSGQLFFDDVRVPAANRVGDEYAGNQVLMAGTEIGRLACAARALGGIRACLDASIAYAKQREVFGQPIARYQLIQAKIAEMVINLEAARALTYKLAWQKDSGQVRVQQDASIVKYLATEAYAKASTEAVQIHGAYGCSEEFPVGRHFRDAKFMQIYDGTNEIHQIIIAEHALGIRGT